MQKWGKFFDGSRVGEVEPLVCWNFPSEKNSPSQLLDCVMCPTQLFLELRGASKALDVFRNYLRSFCNQENDGLMNLDWWVPLPPGARRSRVLSFAAVFRSPACAPTLNFKNVSRSQQIRFEVGYVSKDSFILKFVQTMGVGISCHKKNVAEQNATKRSPPRNV